MKVINPASGQIIDDIPEDGVAVIQSKLQAARDAFPAWRALSFPQRGRLLVSVATILRQQRTNLAHLMAREMGKPLMAGEAEIDKCAACCEHFAAHAENYLAARSIATEAADSHVRFEPLGAVLAIMPWNFPFWQVFRFAAPALMAGNVGLLKHAPNVPGCAKAIAAIFKNAGCEPGVFASLLMEDNAAAERLVAHDAIAAVTLTGSERAGSAVASAAGRALKKTVMELGGSDAFIVLADADIDHTAEKAAESRCINSGQSCIAAKRFIVEKSIAPRFERAMVSAMQRRLVGDPTDRAIHMGPLARRDLLDALHRQVVATVAEGADLLCGGKLLPGPGFFYPPTVLTRVLPGMMAFDQETFGPVAAIVHARHPQDCVRLANQSRYGLGASIWTRDARLARHLAAEIAVGNVYINHVVFSDPRLPFGGIKASGWGRELSSLGITEFCNAKTVYVS